MGLIKRRLDIPRIGEMSCYWPEGDECLYKWAHQASHIDLALPFIADNPNICVQAGGACGIWPLVLSTIFNTVYTFEPYMQNYKALTANCADVDNIISLNTAVGSSHKCISIGWANPSHSINFGAQHINGKGVIPVLMIDDLALSGCDFLCIDIEGTELDAMRGAEVTIKKYHPVIMFEECGHSKKFGYGDTEVRELLEEWGYSVISKTRSDVLMVHER